MGAADGAAEGRAEGAAVVGYFPFAVHHSTPGAWLEGHDGAGDNQKSRRHKKNLKRIHSLHSRIFQILCKCEQI